MNIDIVTPTLNAEEYLALCIESSKYIRDKGARHVITDSFSNDRTLEIIKNYKIEYISTKPGNMYEAINEGIAKGCAPWVTYINADDLLFSRNLDKAKKMMENDTIDIIYGDVDYINKDGALLHGWKSPPSHMLHNLFSRGFMPIPQPGTIFRRSLWESLNGFDKKYKLAADFDFFIRALKAKARFEYLKDGPVAAFRLHKNQLSDKYKFEMDLEVRDSVLNADISVNIIAQYVALVRYKLINIENYYVRYKRSGVT